MAEPLKNRNPSCLFDCLTCGGCCHGPAFGEVTVILTEDEVDNFPAKDKQFERGSYYIKSKNSTCVYYDKATSKCGVYEKRPMCCRIYPLTIIGNNVVIQSECPDSVQFMERFKSGDPEAVKFVDDTIEWLNKQSHDYLWTLRYDSGMTDNLFVFGRINDPSVQ